MKFQQLKNIFEINDNYELINFEQKNSLGQNPLLYVLDKNKKHLNSTIDKEQIQFLIENSNLKTVDNYHFEAITHYLENSDRNFVKLDKEYEQKLINSLHLNQSLELVLKNKDYLDLSIDNIFKIIDKFDFKECIPDIFLNHYEYFNEHNLNRFIENVCFENLNDLLHFLILSDEHKFNFNQKSYLQFIKNLDFNINDVNDFSYDPFASYPFASYNIDDNDETTKKILYDFFIKSQSLIEKESLKNIITTNQNNKNNNINKI